MTKIDFSRIEAEIHRVVREATESRVITDIDCTDYELRTSALSLFCPTHLALSLIYGRPSGNSFAEDYYTGIGTAIHEVVQRWFPLYGKWKCKNCGKIVETWGPIICCRTMAKYVEYSLFYKGLTGHCDGIIKLADKIFLLEIKTSNAEKIKKMKSPKREHICQANLYAAMVNRCLKLESDIEGHIIIYFDRAKHNNYKIFVNPGVDYDHSDKMIESYYKTMKLIERKEFTKIKKVCKTKSDAVNRHCPYQNICFSPIGVEKHLRNMEHIRNMEV